MMQVLNGSIVALVTPMNEDGSVDFNAIKKLVDWHVKEGTSGIVAVGTSGESATLEIDEHLEVIKSVVKYADGRIPIIAGSGSNSTAQAIKTTSESYKIGADYSLLVTPYYNKPSQKGLIEHYLKIADSCDIKQILYNVPSRTSCDLRPDTVEILSRHENIIGIKESVNTKERMKKLKNISDLNKDFLVFSGDDETFIDLLSIGGSGVISVAANVIPKAISEICMYYADDKSRAIELNKQYKNLYKLLFVESNPIPVKWMMHKMGLIKKSIRLPLIELDKKYHEKVINEMLKLQLL
jgi:4-hydroxy-tetrahydrodipicolinate synthase|tara:strand:- start:220 stop:1107 length:888 start_codon:yes stop_codon:yes gene_type:complete